MRPGGAHKNSIQAEYGRIMICELALYINLSKEPWTERDFKHGRFAEKRCEELYPRQAPCLKKFIKVSRLTYRAVCGGHND